jgi:hypothetical protein
MASEEEHLAQFEHNLDVSQRLAAATDYDWAIVVLFYASLHLVQAWCVRNEQFIEGHRQREQAINGSNELFSIADQYRVLRVDSENARYRCRRFTQEEFEAIRDGVFATVREHLQALLGGTR